MIRQNNSDERLATQGTERVRHYGLADGNTITRVFAC